MRNQKREQLLEMAETLAEAAGYIASVPAENSAPVREDFSAMLDAMDEAMLGKDKKIAKISAEIRRQMASGEIDAETLLQHIDEYAACIQAAPQSASVIFPMCEQDILDVPIEKRFFIFWQSPIGGRAMPGYLLLCMETFIRFHPDIKILLLNYDNIPALLDGRFDLARLGMLSFPMQSDVLIMFFLYHYGGAFIDVDMIFTRRMDCLDVADKAALYALGKPGKSAHLAFFLTHQAKNFLIWHALQMQKAKLSFLSNDREDSLDWDFVGNSIIDPLVEAAASSPNAPAIEIIDSESMFLESKFGLSEKYGLSTHGYDIYKKFYFSPDIDMPIEKVLGIPEHGIVYLHHSWTPYDYRKMSANEFLKQDIMCAKILRHILQTDTIDDDDLPEIPVAKSTVLGA